MAYTKEHFEAAFQLITAVSHQVIKIDFEEVVIWIDKLMKADSMTDPEVKRNLVSLKNVMREFSNLQQTLYNDGIPVRNIEKYTPAKVAKSAFSNPNP